MTAVLGVVPAAMHAQSREHKRYGFDAPEGRLMGYYSSTVAFSPAGMPNVDARSAVLGVEVSYIPRLSAAQRTAGYDKPEATNLAPAFPRPRIAVGLPGRVTLEASWIPPIRTFDVTANLLGVAISRPFVSVGSIDIAPRLSMLTGHVMGSITCDRETSENGGASLRLYYRAVCHSRQSEDRFEPTHLSVEAIAVRRHDTVSPYAAVGVRREWTRFDIGVIGADGARDQDQPLLELHATRGYGAAGVSWAPNAGRMRGALEVYYAPGSVVTARALAGLRIR
jgi:hypothetical protein